MVGRRILALVNYETSFTLNLRLILVPLYGDYTVAGRIIGLVVRVLSIGGGFGVLALLSALVAVLPIVWYLTLAGLMYLAGVYALVSFALGFCVWWLYTAQKPAAAGELRPAVSQTIHNLAIRGNLEVKAFVTGRALADFFVRLEVANTDFVAELARLYSYEDVQRLSGTWEVSSRAYLTKFGNLFVEPEQLLLALLATVPNLDKFLYKYGLVFADLEKCAKWLVDVRDQAEKAHVWQDHYTLPIMGGIGKGLTGRVTPELDAVSTDFTQQVKHGMVEKTYWRMAQIKRVAELLGGSNKNVLIVGPPGCGKTGIVKGIAYNVIRGTDFEQLKFKRIVSLEVGKILAGTKSSGDVADKLKKAIEDALGSGDVILFVDDIHTLVAGSQTEDTKTSSAYTVLTGFLAGGRLQFIGATNIENFRQYIEPNSSFAQLFQLIEIPPSDKEETLEILKTKTETLERLYKVKITYCALKTVVDMGSKLIHERVFPDKAVDILTRSVAQVTKGAGVVNSATVLAILSEVTHIPVTAVSQDESHKLLTIEAEMKKRVIGQDEAVDMLGSALRRARAGMRNASKPMASFLFVGTTGVGKTETAKTLARTYFGDERLMIRLDMSEYQQPDSISRLLGNPDGSTKGVLTEAVRTRPFALILLDEIEKAHQNILLTFLQVLDDGRLTDSSGTTVDFTNTIIIATSNVGTRSIQEVFARGGQFEAMKEVALKDVRDRFAPELLNRFNGIIVFKPLAVESVRKIATIMLAGVTSMAQEKGIKVTFKSVLVDELVKRGYSPEWGARPLARVIEESVENYLAIKLLAKELGGGDAVDLGTEVFN